MAEPIVRTFEIDTSKSEQNLRSVGTAFDSADNAGKSLKAQLRELQAQLADTDPQTQKYRDLSKAAGELKDKIQDAAQAVGTQAGGAFEKVSGSLGLVTSRIASLDFEGAAEGAKLLAQNITDIKPGDIAKGIQGIGSAFASVGKALLTNPIFLIGAAIAGAIVYAEELLSLIDGVTDADQKLLDVQKERAATAKENFDAISATEQTLKRQGLTEKQITDLKLQALNTAILEQQVVLQTNKEQAAAQIAAAERNAKYLQTFLDFVTFPQRKIAEFFEGFVNGAIDILNKLGLGIEKISVAGIFDDVNNFIVKSIFDPEEERKKQEQIIKDSEKTLATLINQRDGILNEQDAKQKTRANQEVKNFTDSEKSKTDALLLEIKKREEATQTYYDKLAALQDAQFEKTLSDQEKEELAVIQKYEDLFAAADAAGIATIDLQKQLSAELLAIQKSTNQTEVADTQTTEETKTQLKADGFKKGIELASSAIQILQAFSSASAKNNEKDAKRKFRTDKALAIGAATLQTAAAVTGALTAGGNPIKLATGAQFVEAGIAAALGLAQIVKIKNTEFGGGGGNDTNVNPSVPSTTDNTSQPASFNPFASQFITNRPDQVLPRAYVLAGDVASQQEVRENVEDLSRIG